MKDLVLPAKFIVREILVLAICLSLAVLINVGAIIAMKGQWIELLTTIHITLAVALVLYVLFILPRLCWAGLRRLTRGPKRKSANAEGNLSSVADHK